MAAGADRPAGLPADAGQANARADADLAVEYRWRDSFCPHSIGALTSGQHEVVLGGNEWPWCWPDGGTSSAGLRSKNPNGLSQNETESQGMTGQSSGRVMWWMPNTYHSTTSVFSIGRSCAVQRGRPVSRSLRVGNSPHGQRSSGRYGVTQSACPMTPARRSTGDDSSSSAGKLPDGTSLYPAGRPSPFLAPGFTTFHARCRCQS